MELSLFLTQAIPIAASSGEFKVLNPEYPAGDLDMLSFFDNPREDTCFKDRLELTSFPPRIVHNLPMPNGNLWCNPAGWSRFFLAHTMLAFPKPMILYATEAISTGRTSIENGDFLFEGLGMIIAFELRKAIIQHKERFSGDVVHSLEYLGLDDFDSPLEPAFKTMKKIVRCDEGTLRVMSRAALTRMNANATRAAELEDRFVKAMLSNRIKLSR